MPRATDRVGALIEGITRPVWTIESPEGVALDVQIATRGERFAALMLDLIFMALAVIVLVILLVVLLFSKANIPVGLTIVMFLSFLIRTMYFIHFELAWQGRTPGKKICGLRVINRAGGELSPSAIIARNLTREVEFFLPLSLFMNLDASGGVWRQLILLGWAAALAVLPFFNRGHLRAGDLIGGTIVIAMPRRALRGDLTASERRTPESGYSFTERQLSIYGTFELQVLEEFLRRPGTNDNNRLLEDVCRKIRKKTGIDEEIPPGNVRRFLEDFYAAEREALERRQLFGHFKADKTSEG
ncbi:MAG: RDD family protein [Synergistaceae bacterium]|jgi:uncharacterized RDD family membrane protein YckC|nr:RDD family protein [Synergistaceae bacterium]